MLTTVLQVLYAVSCAVVAGAAFRVLTHMTRRTALVRRAAFIALAWGGALGVLEAVTNTVPALSLGALAVGAVLLLSCGWRHWPRVEQ